MEVHCIGWGGGCLASAAKKQPGQILSGRGAIIKKESKGSPKEPPGASPDKVRNMPPPTPGTHDIPQNHPVIPLPDVTTIWLRIRIRRGHKVGKKLPVFKHRIDRIPKKPCVSTDFPDLRTISWFKRPNPHFGRDFTLWTHKLPFAF
jgi:hypothetical protein